MQHCKSRPLHHSGLWDINWISDGKRRGNRETEIQIIKGPLTSNCLSLGTSCKPFWYAWWLNLSLTVALGWHICTFTFSPVWLPYSLFWLKRYNLQLCNVPCDTSVCTQISCTVAVCNSGGGCLGVEDFHVCMHAVWGVMHAEVIASTQSSYVMLEWAGSLKLPLHIAWGKEGI